MDPIKFIKGNLKKFLPKKGHSRGRRRHMKRR